jgi:signal transduction histidine kinase
MIAGIFRPTLQRRVFVSTAVAMTMLFAVAGWLLLRQASDALVAGVQEEVRGSLASVEALWRARGELMRSSSALLSAMSDVRAAFGTRDPATIRDTAAEMWSRGASPQTMLLVTGANDGAVLAAFGGEATSSNMKALPADWLEAARKAFPNQSSGFVMWQDSLWQVVLTPVYVTAGESPLLLNVLVAGERVRGPTLERMQHDTGGTGFTLSAGGRIIATTPISPEDAQDQSVSLQLDLKGIDGSKIGTLVARRPLRLVDHQIERLRRTFLAGWVGAMLAGLLLSFWLARRITKPLGELEQAAIAVSQENYAIRVEAKSNDELGLLARTFNRMCESIEGARSELIRREQIHAAGRLAATIAHDLRNPLSAVTGGAEMIAEMDLPPDQTKRAARNVYTAALRMQHMLEELSQSVRKKSAVRTEESLRAIVTSAVQSQQEKLDARRIEASVHVPEKLNVAVERGRFERVIINLIANAVEAMGEGPGKIAVEAKEALGLNEIVCEISDSGPGVPEAIRASLFQPFITQGKKNGLGLGLALSRQTMLDHGGDLEAVYDGNGAKGACFRLRIPRA